MKRSKPKSKPRLHSHHLPRRLVLGEMDLRGITRGNAECYCIKHALKYSYPKLPLGIKIRLVAEVLS